MKLSAHLLVWLLLSTLIVAAEPALKTTTPPKSAIKKGPAYELPATGTNKPRAGGGWINADVAGRRFVLKFFDKNKKPMLPDVERGFAYFRYATKNPAKAPLNVEGSMMATPVILRPPHNFLVVLKLFSKEGEEPTESYTFHYP